MVVVSMSSAPSFSAPVEGIILEIPLTKLFINDEELGTGTLYITENNVVWGGGEQPNGGTVPSISLLYQSISLHAVQREPSAALYMVLNFELRIPEPSLQAGGDANDDEDFDPDDQPITQLRFVPPNENDLQAMYAAMSQGQALHPDPTDEVDEDDPYMDGEEFDEGEEEFEDAEEAGATPEHAASRLRQLRIDTSNGTQQYDDAEDADIADE